MAIEYYSSIDLNKNELQNAVVQNLGSAPGSPVEGQIYYDTGDDTIYFRNGSAWVSIGGDITGVTAGTGLNGGGTTGAVTLNVDAAQTAITSVLNTSLVVGRDADNQIKFGTDNNIIFRVGAGDGVTFKASGEIEAASLDISGDADIDGTLHADGLDIDGNVDISGNITNAGWTGDVIASAYLDADTAHLTTAQTFTGAKTFGTTTKLQFRDSAAYINSPTANDIEVAATTITLDAASDIQLEGNTTVTGNFSVTGTLNIDGSTTTVDSTTVAIADSMLKLAKDQNNTTDAVDFGFYGQYGVSGTHKYAGLFRDLSATNDPFTFFADLQAEPGATVNTSGTGYALGNIKAGGADFTSIALPDNAIETSVIAAGALPTDVTINNANWSGTDLSVPNGGTGASTLTDGGILVGSGTGAITAMAVLADGEMIVGDGTTDPVAESGSTLRTSIGVAYASAGDVQTGTETGKVVSPDTLAARSVVATIAQSSLTDDNRVTITHNLGTADVIVQLFDMTTEANVHADIARTTDDMSTASTSVITVDFGRAPENDIRCLITSLKGATASGTIAYT